MVSDENAVRQMVRRVVYRTLGMPQTSQSVRSRPIVTEQDLREMAPGSRFAVPADALITPLARQVAMDRRLTLEQPSPEVASSLPPQPLMPKGSTEQTAVAIGADHGGYELKETLKQYLVELGYQAVDCGTDSTASVDYPDFAFAVARLVSEGLARWGIVIDAAGIGSCMAANKVPGVRAAMCYDYATAVNSREHNDANVLTLGAGLIGPNLARQIVKSWLETPAGGDRHARRVDKIMQIERRYLRGSEGTNR